MNTHAQTTTSTLNPETTNTFNNVEIIELGYKKKAKEDISCRPVIKNATQTHQLCLQYWHPTNLHSVKEFKVILLNSGLRVLKLFRVAEGVATLTTDHISHIIKEALLEAAVSIMLVHNHISGPLAPTEEDIQLTKMIQTQIKPFRINLIEHIIFNTKAEFSFAKKDMLDKEKPENNASVQWNDTVVNLILKKRKLDTCSFLNGYPLYEASTPLTTPGFNPQATGDPLAWSWL